MQINFRRYDLKNLRGIVSDRKIFNFLLVIFFFFMSVVYMYIMKNDTLYTRDYMDFRFHLARIAGLDNVLTSPVNFSNFGNRGTMMNNFYPWLTIYPAYLLSKFFNSLLIGQNLYYIFITFITFITSYYMMFSIKKSKFTAIIFSIIYTFSCYRTMDVFFRGALGEAAALAFYPLIFLGMYYILLGNYKKWYWLTLGVSLTMYTHVLSVALATVYIAVAVVIAIPFIDNVWQRIKVLFVATVATFLISLGYLIPFLEQKKFLEVMIPQPQQLFEKALRPSDLFNASLNNDIQSYNLGIVLLLILLLLVIKLSEINKFEKIMFAFGLVSTALATKLFPWYLFQNTVFATIQFPWRILAGATIFLSFAGAILLNRILKNKSSRMFFFCSLTLFLLVAHVAAVGTIIRDEKSLKFTNEQAENEARTYRHNDYAPKLAVENGSFFVESLVSIDGTSYNNIKQYRTSNDYRLTYDNQGDKKVKMIMPIYRYKGQRVSVNNKKIESKTAANGGTEIEISPGKAEIKITYKYTAIARISQIVSLFTSIILVYFIGKRKISKAKINNLKS